MMRIDVVLAKSMVGQLRRITFDEQALFHFRVNNQPTIVNDDRRSIVGMASGGCHLRCVGQTLLLTTNYTLSTNTHQYVQARFIF